MKIPGPKLLIGIGFLLLVALAGRDPLHGSLPAQGENIPVRLNLGIVSAALGAEALVPLSISLGSGTQVGQLRGEVRYPTTWLTFQTIDSTQQLQAAKGQVEAQVQTDAQTDTATVRFSISNSDGLSLPPGKLAELVFTVAEDADDTQMLMLDLKAEALSSGDSPQRIEELEVYGGGITVLGPSTLFGCFFYMH